MREAIGGHDPSGPGEPNPQITCQKPLKASLSLALTLLGVLVCFVSGCQRHSSVALAHGYRLEQAGGGTIRLIAPNGNRLSEHPISQFCVSGALFYGWIDGREAYFLLDTLSGEFRKFENVQDLNRVLAQSGAPRLDMKNSYTFWDIQTGRKAPGQ